MVRSAKNGRSRKNTRPSLVQTSVPASEKLPEVSHRSRSLWKDFLLGIAVCVVFFGLVEAGLRVAGWPDRPLQDADLFVGFSALQPLFTVRDGVASVAPAKLRFFNPASFRVPKPSKTVRVFCFGESTTYGHPFDGRTAFPRWLEDLLNASRPAKTAEVINAGGISYASYRIVHLVREALEYEPDVMVLCMGHNEFLERRTYAKLFDQGGTLIAVRSLLEGLNTFQGLKKVLAPVVSREQSASRSAARSDLSPGAQAQRALSDKPILKEEVTTILDRSAGLDLYHRDEVFSRDVVRHFAHNLKTIAMLCKKAGVPLILLEPVCNLKDFSPFKSEHAAEFTAVDKSRLDALLRQGERLAQDCRYSDAIDVLGKAIHEDPLYAEYYYWQGKALLGLGRLPEARESFVKARDLDVCPLRCISAIEQQVRQIAREEQISFIPFGEVLDGKAAETGDKSGIPGDELFLDHVHPIIGLHQLMAELILDKMADMGLVPGRRNLTAEERSKIYADGMNALDRDLLLLRDLNLAKTLRWAGRKKEARTALNRVFVPLDANAEVHKMMGSFLMEDGKYPEAVQEYRRAVELSGNDSQMIFSLAVATYRAGLRKEAYELYRSLVEKDKNIPDAYANMAVIKLESGKVREALEILEVGLKEHPNASELFAPYGLALALSGKYHDAVLWQRRAVDAEPGDPKHLYNLAGMYCLSGKVPETFQCLELAIEKGYTDAEKMANDSIFTVIRDTPEFQKILKRIR
jgi:Flp pilus assembly protein TadD